LDAGGVGLAGDDDLDQAVIEAGVDLAAPGALGQRDGAPELAVEPFSPVERGLLVATSSAPRFEHRRRKRSPNAGSAPCPAKCLDHLLTTGPRHLAVVLQEYAEHYNPTARTDHFISSRRQARTPPPSAATLRPLRRDRLGGLVHEYLQVA
jgi:hypothetical protein